MTVQYRPDLLPFALPRRIGLPWHGLVTNGVLAAGNGKTKTYPQPTGGHCWKVHNPTGAATRTRTPEEIAHDDATGEVWQSYALIAGVSKRLGDESLGNSEWLYADPAGTVWLMGISFTVSTTTIAITVKVKKRFGHFTDTADPVPDRTVGTHNFVVTLPDWWEDGQYSAISAETIAANVGIYSPNHVDFNSTGSSAVWNINSTSIGLTGWVTIAVTGTGSLLTANYGQGISASLISYGLDDVWEEYYVNPSEYFAIAECTGASVYGSFEATETPPPPGDPGSPGEEVYVGEVTVTISPDTSVPSHERIDTDIRRILHVYVDGTKATEWELQFEDNFATYGAGGSASFGVTYIWQSFGGPFGVWQGPFFSCLGNDMYSSCEWQYRDIREIGLSIGARQASLTHQFISGSHFRYAQDYEYGGEPCLSSEPDSTEISAIFETTIKDETDEILSSDPDATYDLVVERKNNSCWLVSRVIDDTCVALIVTSGTARQDDITDCTVASCSLNPHTGALTWSATNEVGWV